ncbi:MAG TPA: NADH-quinone oxidoreductase subunit N, partial [Leptospiraceae bacterium]|nr:NADH-quinone oxidoreductase subunit N [Leptospiraceae bacterium]
MNLTPETKDLLSIFPALLLGGGGAIFLVLQFLFPANDQRILRFSSGLLLLISLFYTFDLKKDPGLGIFFSGQVVISDLTIYLNVIYIITALLTVIASPRILNQHGIDFPEFYPLILFAVTGMFFMTTSGDFILTFVGLELLSISL